jgi:hypothetical protein
MPCLATYALLRLTLALLTVTLPLAAERRLLVVVRRPDSLSSHARPLVEHLVAKD